MRSRVILSWAIAAVAGAMLGITLLPAEVWSHPAADASYAGFDRNLMYVSRGDGGSVDVSRDGVDMVSGGQLPATLNLLTTPLARVSGELAVTVVAGAAATMPFRIGFWSPRESVGYFLDFGPDGSVTADTVSSGLADTTLLLGVVANTSNLGTYTLGRAYRVRFNLDKAAGIVSYELVDPGTGQVASATLRRAGFPKLFQSVRLALTASSQGGHGSSHVTLQGWRLVLPHERFWAVKVADARETIALVALAVLGVLLLAAAAFVYGWRWSRRSPRLRAPGKFILIAAAACIVCAAGNALLFRLGAHPFDMGGEKLYAYVARAYGADQLYYLPNVSSLASVWRGVPYSESGFPYEPVIAYLFAAIGWLHSELFAGGGLFALDSRSLEYMIKSVNLVFGTADSLLIYAILRRTGVGLRWSVAGAALFLFNPAVWFSMSVWGQTHVISMFFILLAILLAELEVPTWAWLSLAAGVLTRPQMVVFALVVGAIFLRKFAWRENLQAVSLTVIVTFVAILPLTLATSPSLPIDVLRNNFFVQQAGGNEAAVTTVSQDAYSVWPLVTYIAEGASGLQRAFTPSSDLLVGPLTYQRVGQLLTALALLIVLVAIVMRRRESFERGAYIPLIALGITSFLMLLTGVVATHFLLALPLLLLCRRWMSSVAYLYVAIAWTVTTFVPMYGDMGVVISQDEYPLLAASHNAVTQFFVYLYAWDRFITVAVVANLCALVWLAAVTLRRPIRVAPEPQPAVG